tara:strand:- start:173 stop:301 length:129 start_codon:yes stop_codon:yes gene_type:complete
MAIVLFDPPKTVTEAVEMFNEGKISNELMWKYIMKINREKVA